MAYCARELQRAPTSQVWFCVHWKGDLAHISLGPYTFQDTFSPLSGTSQDFGLFQDIDGKCQQMMPKNRKPTNILTGQSYALYSNGDSDAAHDNLITRMNSNFTGVEEVVYTFPSMCKYYAPHSPLTGPE